MPQRLPTVFISHGSPMIALEPGAAGAAIAALGQDLPRPQAVLAISAHWLTRVPALGTAAKPETIHDFHGFPRPLFELRYPAPGAPDVAHSAAELLRLGGMQAVEVPAQGLDHGAWVPLRFMYPDADIPVAQLAVQPRLGPAHHLQLGRLLAPLREQGVLILASGSYTHNLGELSRIQRQAPEPAWVSEFREWFTAALREGRVEDLLHYRSLAPHAARNHPTDEHLLPIFVALGAAAGESIRHIDPGTDYGVLAMDNFVFGDQQAGRAHREVVRASATTT
jgi:4,5-DOPA dioxygenase extradiol